MKQCCRNFDSELGVGQCFDSHRTGGTGALQLVFDAVPDAVYSKAQCSVRCPVLNNLKPGARCGAKVKSVDEVESIPKK